MLQGMYLERSIFPAVCSNEAPRSKLRGITELNSEDFSEGEANPVASYGECQVQNLEPRRLSGQRRDGPLSHSAMSKRQSRLTCGTVASRSGVHANDSSRHESRGLAEGRPSIHKVAYPHLGARSPLFQTSMYRLMLWSTT